MFLWLRRYLDRKTLEQHFVVALGLGLVARLCSAWFVYGPQALDDYKHGVWPAYQFLIQHPLTLPDYRSPLLVWLLASFMQIGSILGIDSALGQVRSAYIGLAILSLLAIVGTYLYVRLFPKWPRAAWAIYLMALFPVLPFLSTRAFGEAVAMSFVVFAMAVLEWARRENSQQFSLWFLGFLSLGIATLFRFHCGLLYVSYFAILIYQKCRSGPPAKGRTDLWAALIAGLITLGLEAGIDQLADRSPLSTVFIYLSENEGGGAKYGVSPWYNPWLFIFGMTLLPFSWFWSRHLRKLWDTHWPVLLPFLIFVGAHSLAAHKEERFLYPILGIELWFVAWLWTTADAKPLKLWNSLYTWMFFIISAPLLIAFCFINTQEGEIEPPALIQKKYRHVLYLDHESLFGQSRFQFYFLRAPSLLEKISAQELNLDRAEQALIAHPNLPVVVFLTSNAQAVAQLETLQQQKTPSLMCGQVRQSGSVVDRLLFSLNPKHNQRRRPTWYIICERGSA